MRKATLLWLVLSVGSGILYGQNPILLKAMQDELDRSVAGLKLENAAAPYFVSYLVRESSVLNITANSGALTVDNQNLSRSVRVDLRIGDYAMDNSNFGSTGSGLSSPLAGGRSLPLDDDYEAIRYLLWLETDRLYKQAVDLLAKKKAYLQNVVRTDILPDFTRGEKTSVTVADQPLANPRAKWARIVGEISRAFLKPAIQQSRVALEVRKVTAYYVNSEGTQGVEPTLTSRLTITASAQADDGMPLRNCRVFMVRNPDELPAQEELAREVQQQIAELLALQSAPLAEDYSGPVLFAGNAAAEVLAQGLVPNLLGRRIPLSDSPQFAMVAGRMENPYLNKINTRVMAASCSVKAVPTLKSFGGKPLLGAYALDEEGVPAQDVPLIEKGMLKNLLLSRAPVKGFDKSNGHSRGGTPAPSVIQLASEKRLPAAELKNSLLEKIKEEGLPYGILVRSLLPPSEALDPDDLDLRGLLMSQMQPNPSMFNLTKPVAMYRVFADGREELVRGASFGGISINAFKEIPASSDEESVYSFQTAVGGMPGASSILSLLMGMGGSAMEYPATIITPSFILPGIDIKKASGEYRKPPSVGYPGR